MEQNKAGLTIRDVEEHWMKIVGAEKRLKTIKTYIDWEKQFGISPRQDAWFDVGETQSTRYGVGLREAQIKNLKFQMQEREVATKKEFIEYIKDINNLQKDWKDIISENSTLTIISREETPRLFELLDTMIPQEFTPFVYLRIFENGPGLTKLGLEVLKGIKELETSNKESSIRFFYSLADISGIDQDEQNGITRIGLYLTIKQGDTKDLSLWVYLPIKFRLVHRPGTSDEPKEVKERFIKWWFDFISQRITKMTSIEGKTGIVKRQATGFLYGEGIEVKEGYRQIFEKLCKLSAIGFGE